MRRFLALLTLTVLCAAIQAAPASATLPSYKAAYKTGDGTCYARLNYLGAPWIKVPCA